MKPDYRNWVPKSMIYEFAAAADKFKKQNPEHAIEIVSIKHDADNGTGATVEVFNHRTGKFAKYWNFYSLKQLLDSMLKDNELFCENSKAAKIFQKLTGQKLSVNAVI